MRVLLLRNAPRHFFQSFISHTHRFASLFFFFSLSLSHTHRHFLPPPPGAGQVLDKPAVVLANKVDLPAAALHLPSLRALVAAIGTAPVDARHAAFRVDRTSGGNGEGGDEEDDENAENAEDDEEVGEAADVLALSAEARAEAALEAVRRAVRRRHRRVVAEARERAAGGGGEAAEASYGMVDKGEEARSRRSRSSPSPSSSEAAWRGVALTGLFETSMATRDGLVAAVMGLRAHLIEKHRADGGADGGADVGADGGAAGDADGDTAGEGRSSNGDDRSSDDGAGRGVAPGRKGRGRKGTRGKAESRFEK